MNTRVLVLAALAVPLPAGPAPAAAPTDSAAWLHIRVEEPARKSRVHVNLPMPAVEAALKAAPDAIASGGRIHLGGHGPGRHLDVADFREMWKSLQGAGDAEIVSVEDGDDHVNISKKGDLLQIRVRDNGESETVHVDVPAALVDALFSGPGDELNMRAAAAELRKMRGDVVRVDDRRSTVRIWIDGSADSQGGK
jgi:hypothetical protein